MNPSCQEEAVSGLVGIHHSWPSLLEGKIPLLMGLVYESGSTSQEPDALLNTELLGFNNANNSMF